MEVHWLWLPWWLKMVKNLSAIWETGVGSLGREDSPGGGNGNPLQYSCPENPTDRGSWWGTVHGVAESDTTEQQSNSVIQRTLVVISVFHGRMAMCGVKWFCSTEYHGAAMSGQLLATPRSSRWSRPVSSCHGLLAPLSKLKRGKKNVTQRRGLADQQK